MRWPGLVYAQALHTHGERLVFAQGCIMLAQGCIMVTQVQKRTAQTQIFLCVGAAQTLIRAATPMRKQSMDACHGQFLRKFQLRLLDVHSRDLPIQPLQY